MVPESQEKDHSFLAYSAVMFCFCGLLFGGIAIRSYREEIMMRTLPAIEATVMSIRPTKRGFAAEVSFTRLENDRRIACRDEVGLDRADERARIGAVVRLIPRADSCSEAVVVGERNTTPLIAISVVAFLGSLVSGFMAARSMLRSRSAI